MRRALILSLLAIMGISEAPCLAAHQGVQGNSGALLLAREELGRGAARTAVSILSEAIRRDPSDLNLRRCLVESLIECGLAERASREMQQLVRLGMRSAEDFCLLADAYRFAGKISSAVLNYHEALNISPSYAHARAGLALAYSAAGYGRTAEQVCKEGLSRVQDIQGRRELREALKSIREASAPSRDGGLPMTASAVANEQ